MKQLSKDEMKKVMGGVEDPGDYGECDVSCQSGYYSCCNDNGIFDATCKCYTNGSSHSCDNGGTGSSSCSSTH